MKVLVVGSGGREHALCWRIAKSPLVKKLYCAPGNPGTARHGTNVALSAEDIEGLLAFARDEGIDLTVVGPEAPLCLGIQDRFAAAGLRLAGPSREAARLEQSKAFTKAFLQRWHIPTAPFGIFTELRPALDYIDQHPGALVVKADGLAAGKGVFVCATPDEAKVAARSLLAGSLGGAGRQIVVEAKVEGEEASFMVFSDGQRYWPLAGSQDHKTVYDQDQGPNTGGMGAYSPAPVLDEDRQQQIIRRVIEPTLHGMAQEGAPYRGILYVGLMIHGDEISVLEFNCRFGDPETQPILARLTSDPVPYLLGMAEGQLPADPPRWDPRHTLCVVMAAPGYPGPYEKGLPILGLHQAEALNDIVVFHAGTQLQHDQLVTAGGRVLGVTAWGETIHCARDRAYAAVELISWPGVHFRRDIGHRALAHP